ncbi:chaperonin 10-like protein [Phyllosticta capitalensis]|uniref:Chaperonin 10-like protein n=1 Tax=Phyllosticta capitalensis TaxID=121624 RepID=A0ABR1YEU2_9PEZI
MSLPKTYKAAVFEKTNSPLVIKELELKQPQEGQILIKVHACGVCHSDAMVKEGVMGQVPRIPGHEVVGTVVAVPPTEKKWKIGDRVGGGWHGGHDGICKACNRGFFQACDNEEVNGVTRDGGYAEYATLRTEAAVAVPEELDPAEAAPFLCAGVTVFNSIRKMNIVHGDTVAIQGLGGLGHLALQYSRKMGYKTVAISSSDSKKDFAFKLGANAYIDTSKEDAAEALQKMGGASCVVVTAPNPSIIGPLINGLGIEGKLLVLAPVGDIPVNTVPLIVKGISVHGWPAGHALDSEESLAFALNQDVKCMIEKFPLEKADEAFNYMMAGKPRFRAVLTMD